MFNLTPHIVIPDSPVTYELSIVSFEMVEKPRRGG